MHRLAPLLVGLVLALPLLAVAEPAAPASRYIVAFDALPDEARHGRYGGGAVTDVSEALGFAVVETRDAAALHARARGDANVRWVEPDVEVSAYLTPNDRYYATYQYDLKAGTTGIDAAWDRSTGSAAVKVAVIDTGLRRTMEDFRDASILQGRDFINNDNDPTDDNGHGSHVASTIVAVLNNGKGMAGIAQVTALPLKVLNKAGSGSCSSVANGIAYAADQGAHVASLSLGGGACAAEQSAVEYAQARGVLVVAAAGNSGPCTDCVGHPAAYPGVVAVSCTDENNDLCSFSSTGPEVFIAAPGYRTLGHYPAKSACGRNLDTCYALLSGTSMSTPHVSGVAALLKSTHPNATAADLRDMLAATARDLGATGRDAQFGYGLLQGSAV